MPRKLSDLQKTALIGSTREVRLFAIGALGKILRSLAASGLMDRNDHNGREAYSLNDEGRGELVAIAEARRGGPNPPGDDEPPAGAEPTTGQPGAAP